MEVWTADLPFEGGGGRKKRPVVILRRDGDSYSVIMCTTHPHEQNELYMPADQDYAGLERATYVRTDKVFKIQAKSLLMRLGELSDRDADEIRERYRELKR